MAFVIERRNNWTINEAQKVTVWASACRNCLVPNSWLIDRQRNLVLICFRFSQPSFKNDELLYFPKYVFYVGDAPIQLHVSLAQSHLSNGAKNLRYEVIVNRPIPSDLDPLRSKISGWLQEAFEAEGWNFLLGTTGRRIALAPTLEVIILDSDFL
ncbi:MAG TPA: hypothetical protein VN639_09895 [Azonexus sp.]|nr:hypothetical protein [Azonexus sp.]